jgi:V/A-type H+-transporting ATPase subunit D
MPKIKHTKNELKTQREALRRFERFLPMLQLKKQQLQAEILAIDGRISQKEAEITAVRSRMARWIRLASEPVPLESWVRLGTVDTTEGNIAGVAIPILRNVTFERSPYDLFSTPTWIDDAIQVVESLTRLRVEIDILAEQRRRVVEELRTTAQRVNLFEKVKIPECRDHIRVIKIFLGDQQTAAVVRGKIAKRRTEQGPVVEPVAAE